MASESREEAGLTIDISGDLGDWLDEQAARMDATRAEVVRQLLTSARATEVLDGDAVDELENTVASVIEAEATRATRAAVADRLESAVEAATEGDDAQGIEALVAEEVAAAVDDHVTEQVEAAVDDEIGDVLDETIAEQVERALDERLSAAVETEVADRVPTIADAVEGRLEDQLRTNDEAMERLDDEFQRKIEDVRERVIQVKKEADQKAPADHDHEAFDRLDELATELEAVGTDLLDVRDQLDALEEQTDEAEMAVEETRERIDDLEDKLDRVAWVVTDLRAEGTSHEASDAGLARIKRAAAQDGISTAACENCATSVDIALLTECECPHCNAAVADVRLENGLFRTKARLVTATELESGARTE